MRQKIDSIPNWIKVILVIILLFLGWLLYSQVIYRRLAYWNGDKFAGKPVISAYGLITWEGHLELEACGISDDEYKETIHNLRTGNTIASGSPGSGRSIIVSKNGSIITRTVRDTTTPNRDVIEETILDVSTGIGGMTAKGEDVNGVKCLQPLQPK